MHLAHHHIPAHYGLRTDRYKLVFFYALPLDANLGKGQYGPTTPGWELYDLQSDPHEVNNVYGKPGYEEVTRELKIQLQQLKVTHGDSDHVFPELMKRRVEHW